MFHSSDQAAAEVMARSKAVSGGPIYLSDAPAHIDRELVRSLCLESGRILRTAEPALPAPESIFIDSYRSRQAFRALAPATPHTAVVVAYNLTSPEIPVQGMVRHGDFGDALRLLPERAEVTAPVVAFRWNTRTARLLQPGETSSFVITTFGDEMFWLTQVRHGWGPLGRADKFLGPAAITSLEINTDECRFTVREQGPVLLWSEHGAPNGTGLPLAVPQGPGLWLLDYPVAPVELKVCLAAG
jgi:hypothetical protein